MKRIAVLDDYQGKVLSLPYWDRLRGRAQIEAFRDTVSDEPTLVGRLTPFSILVAIRERTRFTASLLRQLPQLELLATTGRNTGHVDIAAATQCGILVTDTGGSGAGPVELTIALMLATVRRIPQEDRLLRTGQWQQSIGIELAGKTLGIVGLGRIGTRIAGFGKFLGMRLLAWGPTLSPERAKAAGAEFVSLEQVMAESDVVSLHLRLTDLSRGIITGALLARMKATAYLVNTARGPLVDEAALVAALRERRIAGAGLDVYGVEPLAADHPLPKLDNVVLTPHLGYVTAEAYDVFFREVVENIEAYLDGRTPPRLLNPDGRPGRQGQG